MKETEMKIQFVQEEKKKTFNEQVKGILGISLDAFISDLKRNEGGKYDTLMKNI